jgi:FkbM family methyltransferase
MADVTSSFGAYALDARDARLLGWAQAMPVNWFGRRAALLLRRMVLAKGKTVIDATVDGVKLRLYMNDNVSERKYLFMPQFFDRAERALMREKLKPGGVFVDIGANAGIYALAAGLYLGETGRVLAVEPNPAVLERLKFNLALNGFAPRTLIEPACIAESEGSVDLMLDDTNLGGSSIAVARSARKITVPAYPLLTVLRRHGLEKIDGLKIDIEGAEDRALIPFFSAAPPQLHPKLLIVENSAPLWKQDLRGALLAAGYKLRETTRMNLVFEK